MTAVGSSFPLITSASSHRRRFVVSPNALTAATTRQLSLLSFTPFSATYISRPFLLPVLQPILFLGWGGGRAGMIRVEVGAPHTCGRGPTTYDNLKQLAIFKGQPPRIANFKTCLVNAARRSLICS
eukprot:5830644-Pyramimonas_sp.AAC.1